MDSIELVEYNSLEGKAIEVPMDTSIDAKIEVTMGTHIEIPMEASVEIPMDTSVEITLDRNQQFIVKLFTDGSCVGNGKRSAVGGFAAIFVDGFLKGKRLWGKLQENATNIRAEGLAIITALEYLSNSSRIGKWKECQIYTDSEFWINMVTRYMPKWSSRTFEKKANPDLTKRLWKVVSELSKTKIIMFIHVPSHNTTWRDSKDEYQRWCYINNDKADKLANKSRLMV